MSILFGPQGYATPPQPDLYQVPASVQALVQPPPQQPAREVTSSDRGNESSDAKNEGEDRQTDAKGTRRGRFVDIKS